MVEFKSTTIDTVDGGSRSAKLAHLQSVFKKSSIELRAQPVKKKTSVFQKIKPTIAKKLEASVAIETDVDPLDAYMANLADDEKTAVDGGGKEKQ